MNIETDHLAADENLVLQYLKNWPDIYISGMEIASRADGKSRFVEEPRWAGLALFQLMELSLVESDRHGKYRVKSRPTMRSGGKKRFIAPHLRDILEKHGRKFELSA